MTAHLIIVTVARHQFKEYSNKTSLFFHLVCNFISMYISFLNLIVFAGHADVFALYCVGI